MKNERRGEMREMNSWVVGRFRVVRFGLGWLGSVHLN